MKPGSPILNADSKAQSSKTYHHGDLKTALIAAANTIIRRDGADALSLRAIAHEVGVSHMAPYAHFKNKKDLILAVVEEGFDALADAMETATQAQQRPGDRILAYGAAYIAFAIDNPQLYRLMLGQVESRGRGHSRVKKQGGEAKDSVADLTNTGEAEQPMVPSNKRPFVLLREAFQESSNDEEAVKIQALGAWSIVHGMAALIIEGLIVVPEGVSLRQFLAAATLRTERLR